MHCGYKYAVMHWYHSMRATQNETVTSIQK